MSNTAELTYYKHPTMVLGGTMYHITEEARPEVPLETVVITDNNEVVKIPSAALPLELWADVQELAEQVAEEEMSRRYYGFELELTTGTPRDDGNTYDIIAKSSREGYDDLSIGKLVIERRSKDEGAYYVSYNQEGFQNNPKLNHALEYYLTYQSGYKHIHFDPYAGARTKEEAENATRLDACPVLSEYGKPLEGVEVFNPHEYERKGSYEYGD